MHGRGGYGASTEGRATTARRLQNSLLLVAPKLRLTKVEEQTPNPTKRALRLRPSTLLLHGADCLAPESCFDIGILYLRGLVVAIGVIWVGIGICLQGLKSEACSATNWLAKCRQQQMTETGTFERQRWRQEENKGDHKLPGHKTCILACIARPSEQ